MEFAGSVNESGGCTPWEHLLRTVAGLQALTAVCSRQKGQEGFTMVNMTHCVHGAWMFRVGGVITVVGSSSYLEELGSEQKYMVCIIVFRLSRFQYFMQFMSDDVPTQEKRRKKKICKKEIYTK